MSDENRTAQNNALLLYRLEQLEKLTDRVNEQDRKVEHGTYRDEQHEKRISRLESFIIGLLVLIAVTFLGSLFALLNLPTPKP